MSADSSHADSEFRNPELYLNRELSWLAFNERVLDQAKDSSWPLLERLKFLAIFGSNSSRARSAAHRMGLAPWNRWHASARRSRA